MDAVTGEMLETEDLAAYLAPGSYVDSDDPAVIAFAGNATANAETARDKAVALYFAVRDDVRYDPYVAIADPDVYRASTCLKAGRGFCIAKAALLAAAARVVGIPARVAYSDVRNHLCTPRLRELMGTDVFTHHGFTELHLDGRWVKVTPTFNVELCEKFGVVALDFDGENHALMHPLDRDGRRHMEYLETRGAYADVPAETLRDVMLNTYGAEACAALAAGAGDFAAEAASDGNV